MWSRWPEALAALAIALGGCAAPLPRADPASDAPEARVAVALAAPEAADWAQALRQWRSAEDVNAWIGARFAYDRERALALSETQRGRGGPLAIFEPAAFYASPTGVCVDLARFAVESLRAVEPASRPAYLMIEFAPVTIAGNTLRRHWMATFERGGAHWFTGDSKRPGHLAGPYASVKDFVQEYAAWRGREVVAFAVRDGYRRQLRQRAARQPREEGRTP